MEGRNLQDYDVFDSHEELIPLFEEITEAERSLELGLLVWSFCCFRVSHCR